VSPTPEVGRKADHIGRHVREMGMEVGDPVTGSVPPQDDRLSRVADLLVPATDPAASPVCVLDHSEHGARMPKHGERRADENGPVPDQRPREPSFATGLGPHLRSIRSSDGVGVDDDPERSERLNLPLYERVREKGVSACDVGDSHVSAAVGDWSERAETPDISARLERRPADRRSEDASPEPEERVRQCIAQGTERRDDQPVGRHRNETH